MTALISSERQALEGLLLLFGLNPHHIDSVVGMVALMKESPNTAPAALGISLELVDVLKAFKLTNEQQNGVRKQVVAYRDQNERHGVPEMDLDDTTRPANFPVADYHRALRDATEHGNIPSVSATYAQLLLELESKNPVHDLFHRRHFRVVATALSQHFTINTQLEN